MYDTILVPTDGSDVAETAGEYAVSLARAFDADLHVLSVDDPRDRAEDEELPAERALVQIRQPFLPKLPGTQLAVEQRL